MLSAGTRNIRRKGRSGGFRFRHLMAIADALSSNVGVWMTSGEIQSRIQDLRSPPNSSSISSVMKIHVKSDLVDSDTDTYPYRWRATERISCLRQMLSSDNFDRLSRNYGSDGDE